MVCLGDQELMVSKEKEVIVVTEEFQEMHWRVPQVLQEHWGQQVKKEEMEFQVDLELLEHKDPKDHQEDNAHYVLQAGKEIKENQVIQENHIEEAKGSHLLSIS